MGLYMAEESDLENLMPYYPSKSGIEEPMAENQTFNRMLGRWNLTSDEFYKFVCPPAAPISWLSYATYSVGGFLSVLFGVSGGCFSFHLLLQRSTKMRMVKFLLILCLWDMALLITSFAFYGMVVLVSKGHTVGAVSFVCIILYPLVHVAMTGSLWTILFITYERYKAVARPLQQHMREMESIRRAVLALTIGAIVINLPMAFELQISYCMEVSTGRLLPRLNMSDLRKRSWYLLLYRVIIYLTFNGVGPFVLILFLTLRMLFHRRSANEFRQRLRDVSHMKAREEDHHRQNRTTYLLLAIIFKFLICHTAPTAMNIAEFVNQNIMRVDMFEQLADLSNLLVLIHSATNWLIYCRWNSTTGKKTNNKHVVFNSVELKRLRELRVADYSRNAGINLIMRNIDQHRYSTQSNRNPKLSADSEPQPIQNSSCCELSTPKARPVKSMSYMEIQKNCRQKSLREQKDSIETIVAYKLSIMLDKIFTDLSQATGSKVQLQWEIQENRSRVNEMMDRKRMYMESIPSIKTCTTVVDEPEGHSRTTSMVKKRSRGKLSNNNDIELSLLPENATWTNNEPGTKQIGF